LSELKENFGISDGDIQYLNAETDVSFCLFCKTSDVVLGGYKKDKFVGFGQAKYSGLISLTKNQQISLFENEKVKISTSKILQKDKITQYSPVYPFTVKIPNTVFSEWWAAAFESIPYETIHFCFKPDERKSMINKIDRFIHQVSAIQSIKSSSKLSTALVDKSKHIEDELFYKWNSFTVSDICIIASELEKAQMYLTENVVLKETPLIKPVTQMRNPTVERESDFNSLLTRIISSERYISAKSVWSILEGEVKLQANERKFDQYNILKSIIADELFWESRYGNSGTQKFSSLNTTVSRVKKKLKTA
jgi:hypothetical protein